MPTASRYSAKLMHDGIERSRGRPRAVRIERCAFEDKAEITVTKEIEGSGRPEDNFSTPKLSKLSLGSNRQFYVDPAVFTE